jgi:hypothetical protein
MIERVGADNIFVHLDTYTPSLAEAEFDVLTAEFETIQLWL